MNAAGEPVSTRADRKGGGDPEDVEVVPLDRRTDHRRDGDAPDVPRRGLIRIGRRRCDHAVSILLRTCLASRLLQEKFGVFLHRISTRTGARKEVGSAQ
jgi:hypothetical protein